MIRAENDQNIIINPHFPGKYRTVFLSGNDVRNSWAVHTTKIERILDVLNSYEFIDRNELRQIIYVYGELAEWMEQLTSYQPGPNFINCSWDAYFTRFQANEIDPRQIYNAQILRKLLKMRSDRKEIMNKMRNCIRYNDIKTVFVFLAAS